MFADQERSHRCTYVIHGKSDARLGKPEEVLRHLREPLHAFDRRQFESPIFGPDLAGNQVIYVTDGEPKIWRRILCDIVMVQRMEIAMYFPYLINVASGHKSVDGVRHASHHHILAK